MLKREDVQTHLADMPFAEMIYDPNHSLLRLSRAIHWDNLLDELAVFYSPRQGRPTIPLRAQAGTLMLKHIKNLPDRDAVQYVKENKYAWLFCGLSPTQAATYMNPTTGLTHFREQIGVEGMALIQDVLTAAAEGKRLARGGKLIVDTTCVPVDIQYPTDIRLLERCRLWCLGLMKEAKRFGMEVVVRTYARIARKVFVSFSKLSKPAEKTRRRVHKQMFQFVRRNFGAAAVGGAAREGEPSAWAEMPDGAADPTVSEEDERDRGQAGHHFAPADAGATGAEAYPRADRFVSSGAHSTDREGEAACTLRIRAQDIGGGRPGVSACDRRLVE